ncbi:MAG: AhpC/TSA family protein [Terriglobales bacterium]
MRERAGEFEKRGVALACVVQGTASEATRFCGRHGVESLCIPDPDRESYRALGLGRASWREILFASADAKRRRAETKRAGCSNNLEGARQKHSDILQLPGAALVAADGTILWLHRSRHTGDLPSADQLLEIVGKYAASGSGRP